MRYVLNGPLKEYRNNMRTDKAITKLIKTTLITQQVFTQIRQSIRTGYISFEAIVFRLIFRYCNTLAAGLHQVTLPEMGVILRVADGEISIFSFDVVL